MREAQRLLVLDRQEDVERIAQVAIDRFGGFDSWVNNAAAAFI